MNYICSICVITTDKHFNTFPYIKNTKKPKKKPPVTQNSLRKDVYGQLLTYVIQSKCKTM